MKGVTLGMENDFLQGNISPRNFHGRYVILPQEVDSIHGLEPGTTARRFEENKDSLIKGEDYYISNRPIYEVKGRPLYLTASGYLKLTEDKEVQGKMFNYYFAGMIKTKENGRLWQEEINDLIGQIEDESNLKGTRILSLAYKELSAKYDVDLNRQKKKYLKNNREMDNVSVLEVVHWLELTRVIPERALKLCLEKLYDETLPSEE